jgi:hypothetical protein
VPQEEALAMETYTTWLRLFELQRYYSWIVDRFHNSTRAYQLQTYGKDYDFGWLEQRLTKNIGTKCCRSISGWCSCSGRRSLSQRRGRSR